MKEIKILIRIDDENNRMGFALEKEGDDDSTMSEVLKVIGALDILKPREMSKLERMSNFKMRK